MSIEDKSRRITSISHSHVGGNTGDDAGYSESKIPREVIFAVIAICVLPFLLNLMGVDFGTQKKSFDISSLASNIKATDAIHKSLSGSFTHTILEWTAFCTAIFTVILAFAHFKIENDITTPIIGMALFCAGCMDAFHTLAADRLIVAVADNRNLIPFTWAICRVFNALIMVTGAGLFLKKGRKKHMKNFTFVVSTSLFFGIIAYGVIYICATSTQLPRTMFPNSTITRPWDVAPLVLFIFAGIFIFPRFYSQVPSPFSHALLVSLIPQIATQFYMAFGSTALFDNNFNIAHFLKIIAYFVPFIGLVIDYIQAYRKETLAVERSESTKKKLEEQARELRFSNNALEQEIAGRKRAEQAEEVLRESKEVLQIIGSCAFDALIMIDDRAKVVYWNSAAEKMFGYSFEYIRGKNIHETITPLRYREAANKGFAIFKRTRDGSILNKVVELNALRRDGSEFPIEITVSAIKMQNKWWAVATVRNVSERKQMEFHLRHSQKLEAVGELAAGIAHEINTPIQYVGDNTFFLKNSFSDINKLLHGYGELLTASKQGELNSELIAKIEETVEEADLEYLLDEIPNAIDQSLEGVKRVSEIVRAMKEFSHPGVEDKIPTNLSNAIQSTITVSRNEWKYVAEVLTDFDPLLPNVSCVPGDFNQVILNLIVNAAHAVTDIVGNSDSKGKITVSTKQDGGWAEIRVTDTGTGVPSAVRERIFDPFFTTKEIGKGTGQGLAVCHSIIVNKHSGTITFESEKGKGTVFIVRLPIEAKE